MLRVALLGPPNAGKSCVFRALTGEGGDDAPAPFSTEEPLRAPMRGEPEILVCDLPGIARGSHAGEWLGLDWLEAVRDTDLLIFVSKCFQTGAGPLEQPGCTGDPLWDLEALERELLIADVHAIAARLEALGPHAPEREILEQVGEALAGGQPAREMGLGPDEMADLTGVPLLTSLPALHLLNVDERTLEDPLLTPAPELLLERLTFRGAEPLIACARLEADAALLPPDEATEFLAELGVDTPLAPRVTSRVQTLLGSRLSG